MSPFHKPVILDNNCISNFQLAGSLKKVLTLWPPGTFKIPQRVVNEANNWREHGKEVCEIIKELEDNKMIEVINIDDNSDEELDAYIKLRLSEPILGEGESESIAIANNRGYCVATDDRIAKQRCNELFPSVQFITTAEILNMGKKDTLLKNSEVNEIWKTIRTKEESLRVLSF